MGRTRVAESERPRIKRTNNWHFLAKELERRDRRNWREVKTQQQSQVSTDY